MHAIGGQFRVQAAVLVGHGRVVIQIDQALLLRIGAQCPVERGDLAGGLHAGLPRVVADRQYRGQHDADVVRLRQFHHRVQVVFDHRLRGRSGVAGDIVGACQDHHHGRLQRDDILLEAHQHLRRGLPGDAAVDVRLAREEALAAGWAPAFGDRVAVEHHALRPRRDRRQCGVLGAVALQLRPVQQALLHLRDLCGRRLVCRHEVQRIDRRTILRLGQWVKRAQHQAGGKGEGTGQGWHGAALR